MSGLVLLKGATEKAQEVWRDRLGKVARGPAVTGLWIAATFVLQVALTLTHSPLRPLPGVITMFLIPGASVMSTLRTRPSSIAGRLVLAVCLSMFVIMVVGCLASLIGPNLGIARPLDSLPEDFIWSCLAVFVVVRGAVTHRDPVNWIFEGVRASHVYGVLVSGFLVSMSILGVAQLNHSGDSHLAIVATTLDVLVLLAGVVGGWSRDSRWPLNTLLYSASLALLLSASLRGGHLYGWDIQQEFGVAARTIRNGRWAVPSNQDAYASMLSLTVLPAVLASLVKLRLLAFFQLVVPAVLALLPVAAFTASKSVPRFITVHRPATRPGLAFAVVVALVISSEAFSSELVSITRQAMALTMLAAVVMVLFDRTMHLRPSRVIIGLLIIAISFTHYTTSYLLASVVLAAWSVSIVWTKGWSLLPRAKIPRPQTAVGPQQIINSTLVVLAIVAAFGWNLGITRNNALNGAASAVATKGAGFVSTTGPVFVPAPKLERILEDELHRSASYLRPVPGANSIRLEATPVSGAQKSTSTFVNLWNALNFLLEESLWLLAGLAMLSALVRHWRRQLNHYSPDIVGFTVAVLVMGAFLRFSGTLAAFYSPSRAAIFVAIFVAAPVTVVLDDLVNVLTRRLAKLSLILGVGAVGIMTVWATGLGALIFGDVPPASMSARGANVEDFTVSTSELATAIWIRNNVGSKNIVQTDEYGQLVLTSEPSGYDLINEIVPTEVDRGSFIYLSTTNLVNGVTRVTAEGGNIFTTYRSTIPFFNRNFNVVYSTGDTRVYH